MTDEQLKNLGEYVVWVEANGNNLQQIAAFTFIKDAEDFAEWKKENKESTQES